MYRLSYKYRLRNKSTIYRHKVNVSVKLQVSVRYFTSIGEVIKVQFTGTKIMYRLSYKYRLGNLQLSVK